MPDSSGGIAFDVREFLGSIGEEPMADGLPVVFIRSRQEQRAFVSRVLDVLQVVPDVAESRMPLPSSATKALTNIGEEARDRGYDALADVLTELMWSLFQIHAVRLEDDGTWGQTFEGHIVNPLGVGQTVDGVRRKRAPTHTSAAPRHIHYGLFHACRLLLEIYLTGKVRSGCAESKR